MDTPIWDFVRKYSLSGTLRTHMPGHKGKGDLGAEPYDITEVSGADSLYEASGIIAKSEALASSLFGSAATFYSAEGSSQCIRAMVYLAVTYRKKEAAPLIVAARNAHRSFLYAAALADADVLWLDADLPSGSLMSCPVSTKNLDGLLSSLREPCCGVYITSPDYLGHCQDISSLSLVCRRHKVPLIVDNAHGAYMHFLDNPRHPLDLGADMCCDSAHKTLSALTGGAYLHISKTAPTDFKNHAREAMALYGSTSPSYLILSSLDICNTYLSEGYSDRLRKAADMLNSLRNLLSSRGWRIPGSDPLRITISGDGFEIGERLRRKNIEPEYAGREAAVLLFSAETSCQDLALIADALGENDISSPLIPPLSARINHQKVMGIRQAVFAKSELAESRLSTGRTAAMPTASCPPAVPVVMPGELIDDNAVRMLLYYGYDRISVVI